jgi:hypothetical protein
MLGALIWGDLFLLVRLDALEVLASLIRSMLIVMQAFGDFFREKSVYLSSMLWFKSIPLNMGRVVVWVSLLETTLIPET